MAERPVGCSLSPTKHQAKTSSSILPDRCYQSSAAVRGGGRSLWGCSSLVTKIGSQGTEFEHFSPNDSLQAAGKRCRGAENWACGSVWFRAERRAGMLFRAVCSAPGLTKRSPRPGGFSPWTTEEGKAAQYSASSCCRMLCLLKAWRCHMK